MFHTLIIITRAIIIALILRNLWRWRWRCSETTHDGLLSCKTINTGVHLTQLITESVKASIHDGLKSHTTRERKRSRGGWSGRGWRSCCLNPWPLRLKLDLTSSNRRAANGTYDGEVSRLKIGHEGMVNDP